MHSRCRDQSGSDVTFMGGGLVSQVHAWSMVPTQYVAISIETIQLTHCASP